MIPRTTPAALCTGISYSRIAWSLPDIWKEMIARYHVIGGEFDAWGNCRLVNRIWVPILHPTKLLIQSRGETTAVFTICPELVAMNVLGSLLEMILQIHYIIEIKGWYSKRTKAVPVKMIARIGTASIFADHWILPYRKPAHCSTNDGAQFLWNSSQTIVDHSERKAWGKGSTIPGQEDKSGDLSAQ